MNVTKPPAAGLLYAIQRHQEKEAAKRKPSGRQVRRVVAKAGRNDPCPCGSGQKFKKCCL